MRPECLAHRWTRPGRLQVRAAQPRVPGRTSLPHDQGRVLSGDVTWALVFSSLGEPVPQQGRVSGFPRGTWHPHPTPKRPQRVPLQAVLGRRTPAGRRPAVAGGKRGGHAAVRPGHDLIPSLRGRSRSKLGTLCGPPRGPPARLPRCCQGSRGSRPGEVTPGTAA